LEEGADHPAHASSHRNGDGTQAPSFSPKILSQALQTTLHSSLSIEEKGNGDIPIQVDINADFHCNRLPLMSACIGQRASARNQLDSSTPLATTPPRSSRGLWAARIPILSPCSGPYLLAIDLPQSWDVGLSTRIKGHRCAFIPRLNAITCSFDLQSLGGRRAHRQRSMHYCNTERDTVSR
jgi:hypothetical protein